MVIRGRAPLRVSFGGGGTHSGLIERNGIFTKMWKDYSEAAEWKIAKEVNA